MMVTEDYGLASDDGVARDDSGHSDGGPATHRCEQESTLVFKPQRDRIIQRLGVEVASGRFRGMESVGE